MITSPTWKRCSGCGRRFLGMPIDRDCPICKHSVGENKMNKANEESQRSKSGLRKSSRIIRLPGDNSRDVDTSKPWSKAESFIRFIQEGKESFDLDVLLGAPDEYEGEDYYANVVLNVDTWYEAPDPSVGYRGGWSIEGVKIDTGFKFMGQEYKAGSLFPKELEKYIGDFEPGKGSIKDFDDWLVMKAEIYGEEKNRNDRSDIDPRI